MAMRHCQKCFENNWSFEKIEGVIRATCKNCTNEVEWTPKKKVLETTKVKRNKDSLREGSLCKKCGHKLRLREPKKHKTKSTYYYTAYYWCDNCKGIFYSDKFKVSERATTEEENRSGPVVTSEVESDSREIDKSVAIFYSDAGTQNNGQFGNQKTIIVATDAEGKVVVEEWIGDKTNNEGELTAILRVASIAPEKSVIFSDSLLSVNMINGK